MIIEIQIKDKQIKLILKEKSNILDSLDFPEERQLSEKLLPSIDKLLKKNKLKTVDIDKIEVESDLGENFTTFRIAKTVADTWNWARSVERGTQNVERKD
jgi:tRNA A37 threonylcarbamoyladenosine modification protein TsaB